MVWEEGWGWSLQFGKTDEGHSLWCGKRDRVGLMVWEEWARGRAYGALSPFPSLSLLPWPRPILLFLALQGASLPQVPPGRLTSQWDVVTVM